MSIGTLGRVGRLTLAALLVASISAQPEEAGGAQSEPSKPKAEEDEGKSRKELAQGLSFCEYDNCYELLGVSPTSGPIPVKRAYRRLAAEWHPDRCPGGDFAKCKEVFPKYANAYEVLSNVEMRKNYDYVLANPYEFPSFYLKYSRPKYAPKSDLRFVLFVTVAVVSGMQFIFKKSQREQALSAIKKHPTTRYQERLKELVTKAPPSPNKSAKTKGAAPKGEELDKRRKEAEAKLEEELTTLLPPPPTLSDTVGFQLFKLPLTTTAAVQWYLAGGSREPGYMTRRALGLTAADWDTHGEDEQQELIALELWTQEKLEAYEASQAASAGPKIKTGKEKRAARQAKRDPANATAILADD